MLNFREWLASKADPTKTAKKAKPDGRESEAACPQIHRRIFPTVAEDM